MRIVLQRVSQAAVRVDGEIVGEIDRGLLLLVAIEHGDGEAQVRRAARRLAELRLFPDDRGRMHYDVRQVGGAVLIVSQFTLAGSLEKGRRPSFNGAAEPGVARELVELLGETLRGEGLPVSGGRFGAHMEVSSTNDGPVTFVLDVA